MFYYVFLLGAKFAVMRLGQYIYRDRGGQVPCFMEAAKELRQVAKLVDSATGLGEGEGRIAKISVNISYSCFF